VVGGRGQIDMLGYMYLDIKRWCKKVTWVSVRRNQTEGQEERTYAAKAQFEAGRRGSRRVKVRGGNEGGFASI